MPITTHRKSVEDEAITAVARQIGRVILYVDGGTEITDDVRRLARTILVDRIRDLAGGRLILVDLTWVGDVGHSILTCDPGPEVRAAREAFHHRCFQEVEYALQIARYLVDIMDVDITLHASALLGDRHEDKEFCQIAELEVEEAMRRLGPVHDMLVEIEWEDEDPDRELVRDQTYLRTRTESREGEDELDDFLMAEVRRTIRRVLDTDAVAQQAKGA